MRNCYQSHIQQHGEELYPAEATTPLQAAYLTVSGGGLVTVTNSNSYTGGTNISSGTLNVGNGGSIGSGDIVVNGALIYSHSETVTTLSTISGGGGG